jgi:TetR/AcrR family transcriptional regulator, transcriptional repressor of bet genes
LEKDVVPKRIDHGERRRQLAEALWRVLIGHGFEAISLRQVAATAGVSMGMVQHYFADKEEMVLFALDSMTEQVGRRIGAAFAALPDDADPLRRVRAVLEQMLPLDDERRVEAQVAATFLARAPVDPSIAQYLRSGYAEGHAYLAGQLCAAGIADAEREASALFALADGLTAHTLAGHHDPAEALAVLDAHLARLDGQRSRVTAGRGR